MTGDPFKGRTLTGTTPVTSPASVQAPVTQPPKPLAGTLFAGTPATFPIPQDPGASGPPAAGANPLGAKGTLRITPESAAEVQAKIAEMVRQREAAAVEQPPAPYPHPVPAPYTPVSAPPPASAYPAAPVAPHPSPAPTSSRRASPRKDRSMALFLVLLAALLFSGLLVVLAVAYFAYRHYVVRPAEAARPNASAPAAPSSEGASPNAPAAGDAEPVAAAPPNEAPEASASATSASAASASGVAAAEAASPNVVLTCSPACENLDTISCDGEKVLLVDGGLSLAPGVHECTFAEAGYAARLLSITVKDGERTETTVTLRRRVGVAPEPCGTFINPCE